MTLGSPLKKGPSGAKKYPTHIAPNVWGWADPLGLCKETRPAIDSAGKSINIASDFVDDKRRIGRSPLAPDFYSVPNSAGGRVFVSTKPISQIDFMKLVNTKNAKGNIKVLTGTHGDLGGSLIPEKAFFNEDLAKWGSNNGVDIIDITTLNDAQIDQLVGGQGRTVCAWCYSERSTTVIKSLGFP
ncbi:MAG: hypothetical protein PVG41_05065 [Desulfobacteraceae bacterium]